MIRNNFLKIDLRSSFKSISLTLLGTIILALGTGIFLVPFSIVSGGVGSIGILLSKLGFLSVDAWSYIIMWTLFVFGVIFLGIKFSLSTLIATIFYPILLSILLRTNIGFNIISLLVVDGMEVQLSNGSLIVTNLELMDFGRLIIIAIAGGALTGIGCAITFNGGGSTGGIDVLVFIINKFTNIKTSILSLLCDGLIISVGLIISIINRSSFGVYSALIGILSAGIASLMIDIIYNIGSGLVIDINTTKYKEINDYVISNLKRSSTIYDAIGGFSKINRKVIRVVIRTREFVKIKNEIAKIDPNAFLVCYQAKQVNGYGWTPLISSKDNTINMLKKDLFNKKGKKNDNK